MDPIVNLYLLAETESSYQKPGKIFSTFLMFFILTSIFFYNFLNMTTSSWNIKGFASYIKRIRTT